MLWQFIFAVLSQDVCVALILLKYQAEEFCLSQVPVALNEDQTHSKLHSTTEPSSENAHDNKKKKKDLISWMPAHKSMVKIKKFCLYHQRKVISFG